LPKVSAVSRFDLRHPAVDEGDLDPQGLTPRHDRHDGGKRHNRDRQDVRAEERVDQARLAPFELADDHEVESVCPYLVLQFLAGAAPDILDTQHPIHALKELVFQPGVF
jgi:hypothetical protein